MLDPFTVIGIQVFLYLGFGIGRLVDGYLDLSAGTGHGSRLQTGRLTMDVKIADLLKIKQPLIKTGPVIHLPLTDIMG